MHEPPYTDIAWNDPRTRDWQVDGYGYQWWAGYFEHDGQALSSYAARGYGQQTVMVIPAPELVIAVDANACEERPDQVNQVFNLIESFILPTLP